MIVVKNVSIIEYNPDPIQRFMRSINHDKVTYLYFVYYLFIAEDVLWNNVPLTLRWIDESDLFIPGNSKSAR